MQAQTIPDEIAKGLQDAEMPMDELLSVLEAVDLAAGETLFECGDEARGAFFVHSGRLAVHRKTGFGNRTQVVALLDAGTPVGEGGLLSGQKRSATVRAVSSTRLSFLSTDNFSLLCQKYPLFGLQVQRWILKCLSLRLLASTERLVRIM
ncbi:MAG: hypothetical protein CSB23_02440 [Deltaproteobacteria bacterium]|nr:MAG: hypothetical protein CSB23_02440 [Deltaproteobacteria bacterium]